MKTLEQLKTKSEELFAACRKQAETRPWAVCLAMHEYYRNLYPEDTYIPFPAGVAHSDRMYGVIEGALAFLAGAERLGAYSVGYDRAEFNGDVADRTGQVYGKLWKRFTPEQLFEKTSEILTDRLKANSFDLSFFKGKRALDAGCGSGRYSIALKSLGCEAVVGLDRGDEGLEIAERLLKERQVKGVTFAKGDVLKMPFEDNSFDFIFSNGVLHHTVNMEQGITEMLRVTKRGGKIWFYISGEGGLFWYARKRMPDVMRRIPQAYTMRVLEQIGLPGDRFVFVDNWYVPIEKHTTDEEARKILQKCGIRKVTRMDKGGRPTDLDYVAIHGGEEGKIMWGDGELRYILEKD